MTVLFAGKRCENPRTIRAECDRARAPCDWWGLPNSYSCSLGAEAGVAWILMSYQNLKAIDGTLKFNATYDLQFLNDTGAGPWPALTDVTIKNLTVTDADCVTPGADSQDESAYLVKLVDRRHLIGHRVIDAAYNCKNLHTGDAIRATMRDPATGADLTSWGWQTMVQDIWKRIGTDVMGSIPTLPYSPDAGPSQIELYQTHGLQALESVLGKIDCALAYDPILDTFRIVQLGAADATYNSAVAKWTNYRHWDIYALSGFRGTVPEKVRVLFRKLPHVRGESSPYHSIDVADPTGGSSGWEPKTLVLLYDDELALVDAVNDITNLAALQARATDRAAQYYKEHYARNDRQRIVYPFALPEQGLRPGGQIIQTRWLDVAGEMDPYRGQVTETRRGWEVQSKPYEPIQYKHRLEPPLAMLTTKNYSSNCVVYSAVGAVNGGSSCNYTQGQEICEPVYHERNVDLPVADPPSPLTLRGDTWVSDNASGTVAWFDGQLVNGSDDEWATVELPAGATSMILKIIGLCADVPTGATITNVLWGFEIRADGGSVTDTLVKQYVAGALAGSNKATGSALPTSDTVLTYSFSPAGWGTGALSPSDVNGTAYGIGLQFTNGSGSTRKVYIDDVFCQITFTPTMVGMAKESVYRLRRGEGPYWFVDNEPRWEYVRQDTDADPVTIGGKTYQPGWLLRFNQATKALDVGEDILILDLSTL